MAERQARPDRLGRHRHKEPGRASWSPPPMESTFHTLTWALIVGTNLGLTTARALLQELWFGALLVGLWLLLSWLKLSPMLFWALILFLAVIILLCSDVLFL